MTTKCDAVVAMKRLKQIIGNVRFVSAYSPDAYQRLRGTNMEIPKWAGTESVADADAVIAVIEDYLMQGGL